MNSVTVFCASSKGKNPEFAKSAYELGVTLAYQHITLIYGGAKIGLMGAVADGSLSRGGRVIGVIPDFLKTKEVAHDRLSELITVKTMHERKTQMSELADGFIILPGGFGTLEEFFEILTWAQLGLHQKPIGLLNIGGYYDHLISLFDQMEKQELIRSTNRKLLVIGEGIDELLEKMNHFEPAFVKNWISDSEKT
ncbi:MAG: TIGR00730 family Rossman fold protein [Ekhidna sp.]